VSTTRKRVYGYLAEFKSASALYKAAEKVRDAGFKKWDCYSPYPIHGLDGAMGIKRSILPWFVFFGGMTGTATAFTLAYTTQVVIYPTVVQAKPANIFSIPAFFPVMFELTILFSGFTVLFGLRASNSTVQPMMDSSSPSKPATQNSALTKPRNFSPRSAGPTSNSSKRKTPEGHKLKHSNSENFPRCATFSSYTLS
jgi:Protein of unknown function (DUF3341)